MNAVQSLDLSSLKIDSQKIKEDYGKNGYVLFPKFFSPDLMNETRRLLNRLIRSEEGSGTRASGVQVFRVGELPDEILKIVLSEGLKELVHLLIGPRAEFLSAKPVYKDGSIRFPTPWHQDWMYWKGTNKLSIWIALEDATPENGCLRVIPGTHARLIPHESVEDSFATRIAPEILDEKKVVDAALPCGGILLFHDLLVHGSHPNHSGKSRWSLIPTYRNADEPDESKVWKEGISF